ncbi:hypothetical protein [Pseudoxanthomonas wuyuanensis]
MKKWMLIAAVAMVSVSASAQSNKGYYTVVPYNNNPFVFCTEGMPSHGWIGVNPATGAWTPISNYVNYQWIATYVYICPKAFNSG